MTDNYDKVVDRIAKSSGVEREEIERKIEAKRARLSGLISREGAAQVVAAELGVSFDNEKLKIDELLPGMKKINVVGKIIRMFPVRSFTTKKGDEGKVCNFQMADDTSNIKVVLWDTNHIEKVEKGEIKEGTVVEIENGSIRDGEIHLGSFSLLKLSNEVFDNVQTQKVSREKEIKDLKVGDALSVRAFVVQSFDPRFFHVCPECSKKVVSGEDGFICNEHGTVPPVKRALLNFVIDDGTETIRTVAFSNVLPSMGLSDFENEDVLKNQKQDLIGKEFMFKGNVRMNSFFNNPELILEEVQTLNLDELLAGLDK